MVDDACSTSASNSAMRASQTSIWPCLLCFGPLSRTLWSEVGTSCHIVKHRCQLQSNRYCFSLVHVSFLKSWHHSTFQVMEKVRIHPHPFVESFPVIFFILLYPFSSHSWFTGWTHHCLWDPPAACHSWSHSSSNSVWRICRRKFSRCSSILRCLIWSCILSHGLFMLISCYVYHTTGYEDQDTSRSLYRKIGPCPWGHLHSSNVKEGKGMVWTVIGQYWYQKDSRWCSGPVHIQLKDYSTMWVRDKTN